MIFKDAILSHVLAMVLTGGSHSIQLNSYVVRGMVIEMRLSPLTENSTVMGGVELVPRHRTNLVVCYKLTVQVRGIAANVVCINEV